MRCWPGVFGRIAGTVIDPVIIGVVASGSNFFKVGVNEREFFKGVINGGAVIIDGQRQKQNARA